jgi:hypothetical protein
MEALTLISPSHAFDICAVEAVGNGNGNTLEQQSLVEAPYPHSDKQLFDIWLKEFVEFV